jgi:hypothetical protein
MIIEKVIDHDSVLLNTELIKRVNAFSGSIELMIPKHWRVTVSNDSVLTVDNQEFEDISKYQIFTLTLNSLEVNQKDLMNDPGDMLNRIILDQQCCEVFEYGTLSSRMGYSLSEDLEQRKLLGLNLFASYYFSNPNDSYSCFFFLSHTYGKNRVENQKIMYEVLKSISHKVDEEE